MLNFSDSGSADTVGKKLRGAHSPPTEWTETERGDAPPARAAARQNFRGLGTDRSSRFSPI